MSIKHAILGFLSWKPFTGYELKKWFADSLSFHWSGNNNQIYGTLIQLHKDGLVTNEIVAREKYPDRKVYAITQAGFDELRAWLGSGAELPRLRADFHIRLAWADMLGDEELHTLIGAYESRLRNQILMCRETLRRGQAEPARTPRETLLWNAVAERNAAVYEDELAWAGALGEKLGRLRLDGSRDVAREDMK
ncbi:MAG: PadR family transcriptional regulator [Spirochaetes bacterium]|nr:PadR family transcriptional regulator [Spirochaetota bacterium]